MVDNVLEVRKVRKSFANLQAVNDVSFDVPKGNTLGLIGPNGAGKTTLLRIICTLAKPDGGDVRLMGKSVVKHPRLVRQMLGFMPAEFGCPRNLNILEYLEYFACLHAISSSERSARIKEVCELTDLSGREAVMVKGLSTGNKQRLLLAKTLLHDPELLVLDEPASGLDPRARTELREIIKTLASLGKTIIISSHILPDLEDISDHIAILEQGELVVGGSLESLREKTAKNKQKLVRLKVPASETEKTRQQLIQLDSVSDCEVRDQFLVLNHTAANGNFLLKELLARDLHVQFFAEDEPNLEEIFMRSTEGKVT